jgi:hypothetical protein
VQSESWKQRSGNRVLEAECRARSAESRESECRYRTESEGAYIVVEVLTEEIRVQEQSRESGGSAE